MGHDDSERRTEQTAAPVAKAKLGLISRADIPRDAYDQGAKDEYEW
jgi:hypothetical protein